MSGFGELLEELKRRKVYRAGIAYAIAGLAVLEIADLLLPALPVPEWVYPFLVVVTLAGFPLALVLAWALELTPDGIRTTEGRSGRGLKMPAYLGLAVTLAVTGSVGWTLLRAPTGPSTLAGSDGRIRLAVLPFENMSGTPEDLQFTDGIHEEILNRLANVQAFHVISRTSVMGYREDPKPVPTVADELGVTVVLEGSVRRALRTNLGATEQRSIERRPTTSLAAYESFARGRTQLETWSDEGVENAVAYFGDAIEADPDFALAYAGLAEAYAFGIASGPFSEAEVDEAREAASRALELDEELGAAHTARAILHYYIDRDWEASERRFRRGLQLSPNDPNAHHWFGHLLMTVGRVDESLEIAERGYELDPLSPAMNLQWAYALFNARCYDDAVEQLRRTIALEADYGRYASLTARALARLGRLEEAEAVWARMVEGWGEPSHSETGCFLALIGRRSGAERHLRELRAVENPSPGALARLEACLGNEERALRALDRSVEEGQHPLDLVVDPRLDALRDDPRYRAAARAWGLPTEPVFGSAP